MSEFSDTPEGVKLALEHASCFIYFCEKCDTNIHEISCVLELCVGQLSIPFLIFDLDTQ